MTAMSTMTAGDAYIVIMFGTIILAVAATAGLVIDCWPEWRSRARDHNNNAHIRWAAVTANAYGRRGTVTEPHADPSPDPRTRHRFVPGGPVTTITDPDAIRALIAAGTRQQDNRADAIARADGDTQR